MVWGIKSSAIVDDKLAQIFALGEELRDTFNKKVDVFEINEINQDSEFYKTVMREKVLIAWSI